MCDLKTKHILAIQTKCLFMLSSVICSLFNLTVVNGSLHLTTPKMLLRVVPQLLRRYDVINILKDTICGRRLTLYCGRRYFITCSLKQIVKTDPRCPDVSSFVANAYFVKLFVWMFTLDFFPKI